MKIRNGFVSNSSSSSFIISMEHFKSVRELATYMIRRKIKDETIGESDKEWVKKSNSINNQYIENLMNVDENTPVSFPSCNYDTYIKKVGDVYMVATCNNTDWNLYDYTTKLTDIAKNELLNMRNDYEVGTEEYEDFEENIESISYMEFGHIGDDYYSLDKKIVGVETYDYCTNHGKDSYLHPLWKTEKYGKICLECNPCPKRKDKLDKINNTGKE